MKKIAFVFCMVIVAQATYADILKQPRLFPNLPTSLIKKVKPSDVCKKALEYFKYLEVYGTWVDSLIGTWSGEDQAEFFDYLDEHSVAQTVIHYNLPDSQIVHNIVNSWTEFSGVRAKLIQLVYGEVDSITFSQYNAILDSVRVCYVNFIGRMVPGECEDNLNGCIDYASGVYSDRLLECAGAAASIATFFPTFGAAFGIGCIGGAYYNFVKRLKNCNKDYKACIG